MNDKMAVVPYNSSNMKWNERAVIDIEMNDKTAIVP